MPAMADGLIRTLTRLLKEGHAPWSSVSSRQRDRLQSLRDAGVLTVEREGGGRRLVVQNREMVQRFAEKEYPAGLDAAREANGAERLPASDAVLHFRDAKRGSVGGEIVLFRGRPGAEITRNGTPVPIGELTQSAGVGAALLGSDTTLTVDLTAARALAVVENQEAFLRFEELGTAAKLACFAGGRLSDRVIEWLGSLESTSGQIIHCPDYDPVGLSEFQRLRDACGDTVQLLWPDGLGSMIKTYGKAALCRNSAELLGKLSGSSHPEVKKLLALLKRHGQGLEQEVLLEID